MNILYSLQHLGYVIPPQADAAWLGEAGPGPSYLDPGSGGPENDFTNRNTTFMTWNLMHLARMLRDAGGIPAHGNQRAAWDAALAARLETRRRAMLLPGLATAALATTLVFGLGGWFGFETDDPSVRPASVVSAAATRPLVVSAEESVSDLPDWEYLLALQPADDEEDGQLPDDYMAIASIFLEG